MNKQLRRISPKSAAGFTIVEFMIATVIFSVVLLLVSFSIMHISRMYQKSMNASRTQAAARNVVDTVAQAVQYSASPVETPNDVAGATKTFCVSSKQFMYVVGVRRVAGSSVMTSRKVPDTGCLPINISSSDTASVVGEQLIPRGMRLAKLTITPAGSLYTITARVVYGEDDLITPTNTCKTGAGSEFCATSEISTTVQRRL